MSFLFLTAGFPGVGKTTFSHALAQKIGAEHVIGDRIRWDMTEGRPTHEWEETLRMINLLDAQATRVLREGKSVICDVNYLFQKDRAKYYALAQEYGATPVTLWFECSLEKALEQNAKRAPSDVYFNDTKEETVRAMYAVREPLGDWETAIHIHCAEPLEVRVEGAVDRLRKLI